MASRVAVLAFLLCLSVIIGRVLSQEQPLQPSVHAEGTVLEDETAPFVLSPLPPLAADERLFLIVTSFSGDADLYVARTPGAGPDNYDWNSTLSTTDSVILEAADVIGTGALYLGVHGYTNASFTVLAFASNSHVNLTNGMPQIAFCRRDQYTYFAFDLPGDQNFTITVTPITGDPDLYISTTIPFPSLDTDKHTWHSMNFGFDMIDIVTSDPNFVGDAAYYIAVHSMMETMFAITVSTWNITTTVVERVPISEDVLSGSYVYFRFFLSVAHDVMFTLTPLSSGDPDMFISRINERPTQQQHTWASVEPGIDTVLVPVTDPYFGLGWYYIAVSGWRGSQFQLLVSTEGASIVLVDGVPQKIVQPTGTLSYYRFTHGDEDAALDFKISSVKQGTSLNAFMSRSSTYPSSEPDKHDMSLLNVTSSGAIELDPPVTMGTYYFGVEAVSGVEGFSNFTVQVSTEVGVQILEENVLSEYNTVPAGRYRYFVLDFSQRPDVLELDDLTISLKCYDIGGDADLYVGTDPSRLPSKEYYNWKSTRAGADTVTIMSTDPNYILGRYFIAVHGFDRAGFAVVAYRSSSTIDVIEGLPYSGTVLEDHYVYYRFLMSATGSLTITVQSMIETGDPDLYISAINAKPNKYDYQWESIHIGNGAVTIESATWGWYYIGVYGSGNLSEYTMQVAHDYLNLLQGYAISDFVSANNYKHYKLQIEPGTISTMLSVTLISGVTELYVKSVADKGDLNYPNRTHYDLCSTSHLGNTILAVEGDQYFTPGSTWLISVYSPNETDYFIGAISDHGALRPGVPMLGVAGNQHPTHYTYWVGALGDQHARAAAVEQDFHIAMDIQEGEVVLVVSEDGFPTLTEFNWTAEGTDMLYLHIGKDEINTLNLFISVFSLTPQSIFTINVGADDDPTYLLHEQPVEAYTAEDAYSYFSVYSTRLSRNMTIELETCDHKKAPTFYVSDMTENPDNHTGDPSHSAGSFRSIYNTTVSPFVWQYIGVKGANSTYTIKAATRPEYTPQTPNEGRMESKFANGLFTINFASVASPSHPLTFQIYLLPVPEGVDEASLNMETVCGVENFGTLLKTLNDSTGTEQSFTINVTSTLSHIVNVIAINGVGLRAAYKPLVLRTSEEPTRPGFPLVVVLVVFVILALVALILVLVLALAVVGVVVFAAKRSKSRTQAPHYSKLELTTQQTTVTTTDFYESLTE